MQFEWAWQHPHISRHLRDANGKALLGRANLVRSNIRCSASGLCRSSLIWISRTVRLMLSTHPWCTWPLHVKLFTDAAVKGWNTANDNTSVPLPLGFTCAVELEGVDGKSGQVGSGRCGPLSVDDGNFESCFATFFVQMRHSTVHLCTSGQEHRTAGLKPTANLFNM